MSKPSPTQEDGSSSPAREAGREFSVYYVAGEASGDRYAAALHRELLKRNARVKGLGVGGAHLVSAGQDQLFDLAQHAVVGLTDVLLNYGKFRSFFYRILRDIGKKKPSAVVLVDNPGFNLRLARVLKRKHPDIPIIYYISPQVWAWKQGRSKLMGEVIDLLLVIFPFEVDWFAEREPGLKVKWVGHPLIDRWKGPADADSQLESKDIRKIALLPGSRTKEIARHLPLMIETSRQVAMMLRDVTFLFLAANELARVQIEQELSRADTRGFRYEVHMGYQLTHLCRCDLAIVASGSATLECCLAGVPMFIVYKVHPLTYWVGKMVVKLPYIGMVNILAGKKVVPEYLQQDAVPEHLVSAIQKVAEEPRWRSTMRESLQEVGRKLGEKGASGNAAQAVLEFLNSRP